jgi:hypothetical protein
MQLVKLSPTDRQYNYATHKAIVTYVDVAALGASTTGVLPIIPKTGNFAVGTTFRFAYMHLVTAFDFSDAGITSLLIEIGITGGDTDKYLTSTEIAVDGTEIIHKAESAVTATASENTADSVDILFTVANGGSPLLSEATSGEVHFYITLHTPGTDMRGVRGPLIP